MNSSIGEEFFNLRETFKDNYKKIDVDKLAQSNIEQIIKVQKMPQRKKDTKIFKSMNLIKRDIGKGHKEIKDLNVSSLLIAGAILGLIATLKSIKNFRATSYNELYTPEGTSYESNTIGSGGRYSGTDKTTVIKNKIITEAEKQGINPAVALALAEQESHFNPNAKSKTGAIGIFQMTTPACTQVGISKDSKLYNPDYNIHYGLKYFKWCLTHTKTVEEALFAWNNGIGNLKKAKAAGDSLDSWENAKRVGPGKGFTRKVLSKLGKYQQDLASINTGEEVNKIIPSTAGKTHRYGNGTNIGGYRMTNPSNKRNYIELSERAEAYLRQTGGSGIVTSGSEGNHAGGTISHRSGNKIDVQGMKGSRTSNAEYAELCIKFLKNPNTAYINLESFSRNDVREVVDYIKNHDAEAAQLMNKSTSYSPGRKTWFNKGKLLCSLYNPGHSRHLDIGILPDAYSKANYEKTNTKPEYTNNSAKPKQIKENQEKIAQVQKPKTQPKTNSTSTNKTKNISFNPGTNSIIPKATPNLHKIQKITAKNKSSKFN